MLVAAVLTACAPAAGTGAPTASDQGMVSAEREVADRTYTLKAPAGLDSSTPTTLLIGLHGFSANPEQIDSYLGLTDAAEARGLLLALPQSLIDERGKTFWNAIPGGCCDFFNSEVDDVDFLSRVIDDVASQYDVDRVIVTGHSNGALMAHRFACESGRVDGIAAFSGGMPSVAPCTPHRPASVVQVHGDADDVLSYDGGDGVESVPGTAAIWAGINGCALTPEPAEARDVDRAIAGAETTVSRYASGCQGGTSVQVWTITGAGHIPDIDPSSVGAALDILLAGQ